MTYLLENLYHTVVYMEEVDEGVKVSLFHEETSCRSCFFALSFKVTTATGWLNDLKVKKENGENGKRQ